MDIDKAKNLAYTLDRREHTTARIIKCNSTAQGDIETLKHRVESIEGEELPVVIGETPIQVREFAMDTAAMPKEGFNGA